MQTKSLFRTGLDLLLPVMLVVTGLMCPRLASAQQPVYNTPFLTDRQLEDYASMTAGEIGAFLAQHNSYFQQSIEDVDGRVFDPSTVIAQAAARHRINPKVLLATLQKESSGVTGSTRPPDATMQFLMGCVSPSTARQQIDCAAERFRAYHDQLGRRGTTTSGWQVGATKQTQDGVPVTPATSAVAGQFTYTPYAGSQWGGNQPGVGGVYLFYDAWRRLGFDSTTPSGVVASSTVLLLDVSGSMEEDWRGGIKIESAKQAANDVINMIEQESSVGETSHEVAIASFTNDATLNLGLTSDYAAARRTIDGVAPLNRTNIGAGIQVANQALTSAPPDGQRIIILLSDGLTNEGLPPDQILTGPVQEAAAAGTCIYTVGFGEPGDLDEQLLRDIAASAACGEYHYASAPAELERVYIRLRHQSLGTIVGEFEGQVAQGETVDAGAVDVPRNQGQMYATLHWPGSDLDLILTDPRGRQVTESDRGVSLVRYGNMIYVIIENPRPGRWLLQVLGVDVPEGVLDYDAVVSVRERTGPPPTNVGPLMIGLGLTVLVAIGIVVLVTQSRGQPRSAVGVHVVTGQSSRPFAPLRRGRLVIGRHPRSDMVLPDPQVSASHAMIQRTQHGYVLTDLNSRNGTYVNEQRMPQALLRGGERLRIGQTELVFVSERAGRPTKPSPHPQTAPSAHLAVLAGDQEYARYPVVPATVLGRYEGCPVDLRSDALVSRSHARLDYHSGQWTITDLSSDNQTFVNGYPVRSQALQQGDEIRLGNTRMQFYTT